MFRPLPLALAAAVLSAAGMIALGILGNLGLYEGAVEMMERWHVSFDLSVLGILAGALEGALAAFVLTLALAWLSNAFESMLGQNPERKGEQG